MLIIGACLSAITLSLQARPVRQTVLVGEPVSITLIWTAPEPTEVFVGDQDGEFAYLDIVVDNGSAQRHYREENLLGRVERVHAPVRLEPGREKYSAILLLYGRYGADRDSPRTFIFPQPGQYTLLVRYTDPDVGTVTANAVSITVIEATGPDAAVLQEIRGEPMELKFGGPKARSLLAAHPNSAYLRLARLETFDEREARLLDRRDPRTDQPLWHLSGDDRELFIRRELKALSDELIGIEDMGPFEETRLYRAADYARRGGDPTTADRVEAEILTRFPSSLAAGLIRAKSDRTPPTLVVASAPASLWPPNNKLFPVAVTVTATDASGGPPTVQLVSITCDDACNPAKDIAEAAFGTNDRAFKLRAHRTGGGSGRAYTITYEASDAAGNRTTVATIVTVPYDQGKK